MLCDEAETHYLHFRFQDNEIVLPEPTPDLGNSACRRGHNLSSTEVMCDRDTPVPLFLARNTQIPKSIDANNDESLPALPANLPERYGSAPQRKNEIEKTIRI